MTYGSLFAGIGGLDLGLERAGLECRWQVEIDDYARRVLAKHWPNVRRWDDIKTFLSNTEGERRGPGRTWGVASHRQGGSESAGLSEWRVDLIAGGFPCQDISYAGQGAGLDGERSGLFFEAARVIRVLEPRYVLLENVGALLVRGLDAVLGTLASLGYDAEWHCLQAADVGAPHLRDRIFILAHSQSSVFRPITRGSRGGQGEGENETPSRTLRQGDWSSDDGRPSNPGPACNDVADSGGLRPERWREPGDVVGTPGTSQEDREERQRDGDSVEYRGSVVADAQCVESRKRRDAAGVWRRPADPQQTWLGGCRAGELQKRLVDFRETVGLAQWGVDPAEIPESGVGRMAHGLPNRMDRLRGLGNAVVPQVAEFWGRVILERDALSKTSM